MSDFNQDPNLDPCGCCAGDPPSPNRVNRPGLPELNYRIGTYGSFFAELLANIAKPVLPNNFSLEALKTRRQDDAAIAFLDAWAVVADILTFYQERIVNQNYLRTTTERLSVLELARTIGYELNPGVAASTYLAFIVETTPGTQGIATVPQGTQIQSIPGQNQLPQTFETAADLTARLEWNELRPRQTQPQDLCIYDNKLYLWTVDADIAPLISEAELLPIADVFFIAEIPKAEPEEPPLTNVTAIPIEQIYLDGTTNLKKGDRILFVGKSTTGTIQTLVHSIQNIHIEAERRRSRIDFTDVVRQIPFLRRLPKLINAISVVNTSLPFNVAQINQVLRQPISETALQATLVINNWNELQFGFQASTPTPPPLPPADQGIFAFRQQVSFFGHNAPRYETLPQPDPEETRGADPYSQSWDAGSGRTIWQNSQGQAYTEADVYLERSIPDVIRNSWLVVEASNRVQRVYRVQATSETSLVDYALSGKSTGLQLASADNSAPLDKYDFRVRRTVAYVQSERLTLAAIPIDEPLQANDQDGVEAIELERIVTGLEMDQPIAIQGKTVDTPDVNTAEIAFIRAIVHEGKHTTLYFRDRLQHRYNRDTVTINANVVLATHGETVRAVLGSGDGAKTFQTFILKKPPLTYISANTPSGNQTTLSVRVNQILWEETRAFYSLPANAETYIVRIEDDGTTKVIFGDGKQGARLPTGMENITATYRSGIGLAGEVSANSLTLLKTRPLGIRSVTNPLVASGAEAPENLENARINAPLTVLTLERIVSLKDYEDFARAFAGIGKAQAVALWDGFSDRVHLTIAAANGNQTEPSSTLYQNLISAITSVRDPAQPLHIESYKLRLFNLQAKVRIDPRYLAEIVQTQVETALQTAFAFANRSFGQVVSAAEVISLIQQVPGVINTDLDLLYRSDQPPALNSYLDAAIATWNQSQNQPQPAELLLIHPIGISLEIIPNS
ncbi:putative baseplate assembly protein [Nostoc piscinale]|uniref:putative baseplate assembly protein n=1 Tax=Nostoc piscinale TaxID=224012 RepID=UPI0007847719|nr:putative baseplate assembly protein [Nostoc piscinale]